MWKSRIIQGEQMSFTEKIDVLDLLINIIKKHEEKLDQLVERIEILVAEQNG